MRRIMTRARSLMAIALASSIAIPASAGAQEPVGNLGTLICFMNPGTKQETGVRRPLSCSFEPITGPKVSFTGIANRVRAEVPSQAKAVVAWSVLGPTEGGAEQLQGRYVGSLEKEESGPGGLVGGKDGKIRLRPLATAPTLGENATLSILELDLSGMRA